MQTEESTRLWQAFVGTTQFVTFLCAWALFFVAMQVGLVVVWLQMAGLPLSLDGVIALDGMSTPEPLFVGTLVVQFAGMLGCALLAFGVGVGVQRFRGAKQDKLRDSLGLNKVSSLVWLAAVGGGVAVGWFPGWLAGVLRTIAPWMELGGVAAVESALDNYTIFGRVGLVVMVAVVAPVIEEVVFRGILWNALEKWLHPFVVIGVTSGLFALFHLDPTQAIPLIFTGTFLGWIRWTTGSIGPAIMVHVVNNTLALTLSFLGADPAGVLVAFSIVVTSAMAFVTWFAPRNRALAVAGV
jgi:membrane protease YdiL (CAAX protease family)